MKHLQIQSFEKKYQELTDLFCSGKRGHISDYHRFLQLIAPILRRIVAKKIPASDIEDVLQEILISIHKAAHTYDEERPLMPWVYAISQFRISDHLKKIYLNQVEYIEFNEIEEFQDTGVTKSGFKTETLNGLLKETPEREKKILTMLYVEGYTAKQTGEELNMNESAIKVAAHRAIKKIRHRLTN